MKKSKKWLSVLFAGIMALALIACGGANNAGNSASTATQANAEQSQVSESTEADTSDVEGSEADASDAEDSEDVSQEEQDAQNAEETKGVSTDAGSDTLVIYFSRTGEQYGVGVIDKGNTEIVAEMIIDETGADRFQILPAEDYYPYTYNELTDIAKQEQNENARPAYAGEAPDLAGYGTIFIGAPVWWGDWPMICYTFFEDNADALAGKTLIPFSTHGGSGLSGFDRKLASTLPDSTVGEGLAISGNDAQNNQDSVRSTVHDWLSGLGF